MFQSVPRKMFFGFIPVYQSIHWPLEVQLTEQQALLGGHRWCKQHVMLPHDIVSHLYHFPENFFPTFTGEPGRLQTYWEENLDLLESLEMTGLDTWHGIIWDKYMWNMFLYVQDFCFGNFNLSGTPKLLKSKDAKTCVPLRLYGDGANAQQHFEINTILPVLACGHSTLDTRLLCSVRNTQKTTVKARTDILVVLAWSFEALRV